MSSVLHEHSPRVKFRRNYIRDLGWGIFDIDHSSATFGRLFAPTVRFITRVKNNILLTCVQPLLPWKKIGTSFSSIFFLRGGSGCTQAIFYSLAGVVLKICCKILRFPVERDTTQVSMHCTISSVNYTLVLTIREITQKEPLIFEIFLSMFISTWIVDITHWRVNVSCPKNWFPSHFLYKPDSCFMYTFLSCCIIFNKIMDFQWLWYVFT